MANQQNRASIECLENRSLPAAVYPTALEQLMVELINRARANPSAEALRHAIDLNEGLSPGTISTTAKQPLAINPNLTDAARGHAQWILDNDTFSHTGAGGSSPTQRMTTAGYALTGSWGTGENLAIQWGGVFEFAYADIVDSQHYNLFTDLDIPGRGHRTNMMNGSFREVGSGLAVGSYSGQTALATAQDFGFSGSSVFLTGVAYSDSVNDDDFYTVGEAIAGLTITATSSGGQQYSTTTWDSGGYRLALPAGTYDIVATGGSLGGTVRYDDVVLLAQNVKRDFRPDLATQTPFATLSGGRLVVEGTSSADSIALSLTGGNIVATRNGVSQSFANSGVSAIEILAGAGNDTASADGLSRPVYIFGDAGNDVLLGGSASDTLTGGSGRDTLVGGAGDDRLSGGTHGDSASGGDGADRVYGNDGDDTLNGDGGVDRVWGGNDNDQINGGTSNDRLFGEAGLDTLRGGRHNDLLDGGDGADSIFGDQDSDSTVADASDVVTGVEVTV